MSDKKLVGEAKRKADRETARKIVGTKPKKPTAEQLGVSAVVGNRGKVRSEQEKPVGVTAEHLDEYWKEATAHHSAEGYSLVREIERRLGKEWWTVANKGETLPALIARAIKHLATPQPTQTVVVESKPVQQTIAPRAVSKPVVVEYKERQTVKEGSVSKPRGEGWNGLSSSAIFRWCGSQGWSKEECVKIISVLGLTGVSEKSLPTLIKAGKDGFRLPTVSPEIADTLNKASGRMIEQVYSKPKSK